MQKDNMIFQKMKCLAFGVIRQKYVVHENVVGGNIMIGFPLIMADS
jgi:hypothetical protein